MPLPADFQPLITLGILPTGQIGLSTPDKMDPMLVLGMLEYAKSLHLQQMNAPKTNVIPASAAALSHLPTR